MTSTIKILMVMRTKFAKTTLATVGVSYYNMLSGANCPATLGHNLAALHFTIKVGRKKLFARIYKECQLFATLTVAFQVLWMFDPPVSHTQSQYHLVSHHLQILPILC